MQNCPELQHCCNLDHFIYNGHRRVKITEEAWNLLPWLVEDTKPRDQREEVTGHVPSVQKTPDEMVEEMLLDKTIPDSIRSNITVFKQCLEAAYKINTKPAGNTSTTDKEEHNSDASSELALSWLSKHRHMKNLLHLIERNAETSQFNIVQNDLRDLFKFAHSLIVKSKTVCNTYVPEWRIFFGKENLTSDVLEQKFLFEAEIIIAAHAKSFLPALGQRAKYNEDIRFVVTRFICFLVASDNTMGSGIHKDLIIDFTHFNARSNGAERAHWRCLQLFQTIAVVGHSRSPDSIPYSDQTQMLSESSVAKYGEELVTVLSAVMMLPGSENDWLTLVRRVARTLYKKHELTVAPNVIYPILKPDLYRALDVIIEKNKLSPCNISDIALVLLLVETGLRPTGVISRHTTDNFYMKLRQMRFMRNCQNKLVIEVTPTFNKTEKQYGVDHPRQITEKQHKYCFVRWMILHLRLRKVLEVDQNGDYVIIDGHNDDPLFVHHVSGMFYARQETADTLYGTMIDIAKAINMPSNQIRSKSFRKGFALNMAFDLCNSRPNVTMQEVEDCLKSSANWKSKECLTYLDFGTHKFKAILQHVLDARKLEEGHIAIEEFYMYAYELGTYNNSLFTKDHPLVCSLRTHFFHGVALEHLAGYLNIFVNLMDASVQMTRRRRSDRKDREYELLTLDIDPIVRRYPFLTSPRYLIPDQVITYIDVTAKIVSVS